MKNARSTFVFFFSCMVTALLLPAVALGKDDALDSYQVANQSVHRLYVEDQRDRQQFQKRSAWTKASLKELSDRDAARIRQVRDFAKCGRLKSPRDFYEAAMILQHGKSSDDFLLAHILASAAAFRGHKQARWLSAATLDRYLHDVGRAQIFGTQFRTMSADGEHSVWSMDLLNQQLLSDEVRALYGVPPLSKGLLRLSELNGVKTLQKTVSRSVVASDKEHRQ